MLQLVPKRGDATSIPKSFLTKLNLFNSKPELIAKGRYAIKTDVHPDVFDLFMTRVLGAKSDVGVTSENAEQLRELCDELGFSGFDDEIRAVLGSGDWKVRKDLVSVKVRVDRHDVLIEQLERRVLDLERRLQEVPARVEAVEKHLEMADEKLTELQNNDLSDDVAQLRRDVKDRASAADVTALSEELSRLKGAEASIAHEKEATTGDDIQRKLGRLEAAVNMVPQGVIGVLTRLCCGNVHEKGVVEVTAKSVNPWCGALQNIVELGTDSYYRSHNLPGQWICYDFKERRVAPTSYSIRTSDGWYPKEWVFEVSTAGKGSWQIVDSRSINEDLRAKQVTRNFVLSDPPKGSFRFLRLRLTGPTHNDEHYLDLSSLGIFGELSHS